MAIKSLVFHTLTRWQDDAPSTLSKGETIDPPNADHQALFSQLKKLFQFRAGKFFGTFGMESEASHFPAQLAEHLEGKIAFSNLSDRYLETLKDLVDKTSESFQRHIVFLHEDHADGERIWIFLLESASGLQLDSRQDLYPIDYLNTSKLELALRIDIDDWNSKESEKPYLTLCKARTTGKLGEAFALSVDFKSSIDTKKETETLMDVLAEYTREKEPKAATEIRQKAYDFCVEQQQLGESVPLNELSGYLDEQAPTNFAEFASQQADLPPQRELRPDTRQLKHLVRLSGKGNGLSLSFSSDLFQETILFDEKNDTLTITTIPKSLKKQLVDYLKEQD